MNVNAGRLSDAIERLLPWLVVVAIMTSGYLWLIQPRLGAYLRTKADVSTLGDRVRTLQRSTERARSLPPADTLASLREFEKQMSPEDTVAEVATALAKAVLDSASPDKLRAFTIETGNRVQLAGVAAGENAPRLMAGVRGDGPDPRLLLFPYPTSYTPVRITFESTFEAAGAFLWKVRDLPTIVEIRSGTMARGLPLMKTDVLIRVFQRGEAADAGHAMAPGEPAPGGSTAPRVAPSSGAER